MLLQDYAPIITAVSTLCVLGILRFAYLLFHARSRMIKLKRQGLASQDSRLARIEKMLTPESQCHRTMRFLAI